MQKGIKFRIYPNREQKNFIHQTLGCCRLIYNRGLAMRKESYEEGKKIGYTQTSAMLTELKKQEEFAFLKAADSIALQQSLRDLDRVDPKFNSFLRYPILSFCLCDVFWFSIYCFTVSSGAPPTVDTK